MGGWRETRFSRYYVTSLASLCLWSTFILFVYVLAVHLGSSWCPHGRVRHLWALKGWQLRNDFRERGKIMVGVLLVQNVAKVRRLTELRSTFLKTEDKNSEVAVSSKMPRVVRITAYDNVALNRIVPPDYVEPKEVLEDLDVLQRRGQLSAAATTYVEMTVDPMDVDSIVRKTCSRSSEVLSQLVEVKVKFWQIADIDVASATYLAKFHVIMEWFDQAVPQIGLKNAITVSLEEYSDVIVSWHGMLYQSCVQSAGCMTGKAHPDGKVLKKAQHLGYGYGVAVGYGQRLLAELQLVNEGFELAPNFCNAGEQLKTLDGWNFTTAALAQPMEDMAASRQRVTVPWRGGADGYGWIFVA
eukprot:Skav208512  [mRNA]  locus=scaffold1322:30581:39808:+ [translate_table: standard]